MIQKKTVTSGTLLSICRNLSERAGLAVIVAMTAGWPLRPDRLLNAGQDPVRPSPRDGILKPMTLTTTVLVVEDDRDLRRLLRDGLVNEGFTVETAAGGREALLAARHAAPELLVIDIGLPDVSGVDIAKTLRTSENGARMRLVALTGYSDSATRKLAAEAGFDDFVVKPFSTENLANLLNTQL